MTALAVRKHRILLALGLALGLFLVLVTLPRKAHAQSPSPQPTPPANAQTYSFRARPGDSLTLFVRRALQLATHDKPLEPAQAIFAETNIVQDLGCRLLEIGESVTIPLDLLQKWSADARTLSPEVTAAWQAYVTPGLFAIEDVAPTQSPPAGTTGSTTPAPSPQQNPQPTPEPTPEPPPTNPEAPQPPTQAPKQSAGWYWWLIGVGILAAIYFVLGGPTPRGPKKL